MKIYSTNIENIHNAEALLVVVKDKVLLEKGKQFEDIATTFLVGDYEKISLHKNFQTPSKEETIHLKDVLIAKKFGCRRTLTEGVGLYYETEIVELFAIDNELKNQLFWVVENGENIFDYLRGLVALVQKRPIHIEVNLKY